MVTEPPLFVVALLMATGISLALAGYLLVVGRRRDATSATLLAVLMFATAVWAAGAVVQLFTGSARIVVVAEGVIHVVSFAIPVLWFLFAIQFAGDDRYVTTGTVAALAVVPILSTLAVATSTYHELFFVDFAVAPDRSEVVSQMGPIFFVQLAYSYLLVVAGVGLMLRRAYTARELYRNQSIAVAVAAIVPLAVNAAYFGGIGPRINPTPIGFAGSGVALTFAVLRYQFLTVVPIARESVVETMRDGVVVLDEWDTIVDVNAAAEPLLSAAEDDLVGTHAGEVDLGDRSLLASSTATELDELTIRTTDGDRHVTVRSTPIDGDEGALVLLQDVTDRRTTAERYQLFIENVSDVITVLEEDGTIGYQSPAVRHVLGHDPEEMIGRNAFEYVHPDDREALAETFVTEREVPGKTVRAEYRMRHADGSWRLLESTGRNPLEGDAVEDIVVASRDVTERRRRERELERTNERLDAFAGVVSHDLRNPLNVADGYLELLDERVEDDAIDVVAEQHDRMRRIVDDALALAREGETVEETRTLSLQDVAAVAWRNVETGDATRVADGDATIEADRDRLLRVFENLYRNAIVHAAPDPTVTVGASDGGFYVADDGPGIPPDQRTRVFESGVSSTDEGTGFGLAIVEQIVAAHGWDVEIADADEGARFEFSLDSSRVFDADRGVSSA